MVRDENTPPLPTSPGLGWRQVEGQHYSLNKHIHNGHENTPEDYCYPMGESHQTRSDLGLLLDSHGGINGPRDESATRQLSDAVQENHRAMRPDVSL